jgi:hypothetical protein
MKIFSRINYLNIAGNSKSTVILAKWGNRHLLNHMFVNSSRNLNLMNLRLSIGHHRGLKNIKTN